VTQHDKHGVTELVPAVLVHVDKDLDTAESDLCTVTNVELSAAPRRPARQRTIVRKVEWIPYGETIDDDEYRSNYFRLLNGYTRDRVDAAIDAAFPNPADLPQHLVKVRDRGNPIFMLWTSTSVSLCQS
jgi:fatty acid synthase